MALLGSSDGVASTIGAASVVGSGEEVGWSTAGVGPDDWSGLFSLFFSTREASRGSSATSVVYVN